MDAPAESNPVASKMPAPKRRNHRKARKPYDGRYLIGRRLRGLVEVFAARIGPDATDPVTATAIRRCAETVALSEDLLTPRAFAALRLTTSSNFAGVARRWVSPRHTIKDMPARSRPVQ